MYITSKEIKMLVSTPSVAARSTQATSARKFIELTRRPVCTFGNLVSQSFCGRFDKGLCASRLEFIFGSVSLAIAGVAPLLITIATSHMCATPNADFIDTLAALMLGIVSLAAMFALGYLCFAGVLLLTRRLRDAKSMTGLCLAAIFAILLLFSALVNQFSPEIAQISLIIAEFALLATWVVAAIAPSNKTNEQPRYLAFHW